MGAITLIEPLYAANTRFSQHCWGSCNLASLMSISLLTNVSDSFSFSAWRLCAITVMLPSPPDRVPPGKLCLRLSASVVAARASHGLPLLTPISRLDEVSRGYLCVRSYLYVSLCVLQWWVCFMPRVRCSCDARWPLTNSSKCVVRLHPKRSSKQAKRTDNVRQNQVLRRSFHRLHRARRARGHDRSST